MFAPLVYDVRLVPTVSGGHFMDFLRPRCAETRCASLCAVGWETNKAIYFFEMSVLFETAELNAYVYDGGGLYRRKYV